MEQFLLETITRTRIYECVYWKEECFALNAADVVDKAVELDHIGGMVGQTPTKFLCLVLKLLQLNPSGEIIQEYIACNDFKYLCALGIFYIRLTYDAVNVYKTLEPFLLNYSKLRLRASTVSITYMDEFVDKLLTEERVCDVILPRLPLRRQFLDVLDFRISPLQSIFEEMNKEPSSSESEEIDPEEMERLLAIQAANFKISQKKVSSLFKK